MADPISLVVASLSLVEFSYKVISKSILFATSAGSKYRGVRFSLLGDFLYYTTLVDTDKLQEMHWNINLWTDAEILAWRNQYVGTCNAVSVASAIFASIGLTALQLPDMYTVHWSARALCAASMLLGLLSVTVATSQQQAVALLNNPISIRLWLSRGRPESYVLKLGRDAVHKVDTFGDIMGIRRVLASTLSENESQMRNGDALTRTRTRGNQKTRSLIEWLRLIGYGFMEQGPLDLPDDPLTWRDKDKYKDFIPFNGLPLESSISVLKAVATPRHLLNLAVLLFVVGFRLYLLFSWVENTSDRPIAHRNVFVVFHCLRWHFCDVL